MIPLYIALIVICVILSGFFSAAETAFSCANRIRVKNMVNSGNKRAKGVMWFLDRYDAMISTILIGNNIVNTAAATVSGLLWAQVIMSDAGVSATVSTVVMTVLTLLFGEVTPKTLAKMNPESTAMLFYPILKMFFYVLYPLNWILGLLQKLLNKIFKRKSDNNITDDELITIVDEAQTEGGLDEYEGDLIRSAIEFDDLTVIDILTPRVDVEAIEDTAAMDDVLQVFRESGFTRLPVYKDTIDTVVGVINEKDFLNIYLDGASDFEGIITPVVIATPHMKISVLLRRLQKAKSHLAMVVDEFGGTMGIVTMEDIIEQLVGEIWDEHDEVVEDFNKISDDKYYVQGEVNLEEFFDFFDIKRDAEEFEPVTLSGFAVMLLGKEPQVGDVVEFENLTIKVISTEFYRITQVEVTVAEIKEEEDAEAGRLLGRHKED
ncbi:MAG: hemolysin family protein [Clostridia bacterium]|nr:hemolysin family protein [Clostridia bacterium]